MADFQSWLKRNKIGLWDKFLDNPTGHMRRSRMSNRPMMTSSDAMDKYQEELYGNAMLQRGIKEAVGRAFGDDRRDQLAQENQMLRSTVGQYRQAAGGLMRNLQRVSGEKQGVTSPEMDPYQMARQIPGMERRRAMTTVAGGGGGASNMDMVGMDPTANSPEVGTGTELPLVPMDTGTTLMPPPNPNDEDVTPLASGGPLQRGGVHMVGEAGRELVVPRGDGGYQVIPHGTTEAVMARNPGMRVEGHEDGGTMDNPNRELRPMENLRTIARWAGLGDAGGGQEAVMEDYPGYTPVGGAPNVDISRAAPPEHVVPTSTLQRSMGPYEYYGGPTIVNQDRPVPERPVPAGSYEAYFDPRVGSAAAPLARNIPDEANPYAKRTPGFMSPSALETYAREVVPGAETDRPPQSYYDVMADQWNKSAATAPAAATPPTSAQLARTRPVTLIRGTNVTYANPSVTGEQEFSTPQMAREAAMYTPEAQAEMFELKRQAARQGVANLSTSPVADARMYAAMVRDQATRNALAANLEERTSRESGGKGPTLTMGPHGRPITHPQYLPIAVSELANEAKKAPDDLWAGVNLVNRMQSLISGHPKDKQQEMVQQFQAALPANLAKRLRDYYASKNPQ